MSIRHELKDIRRVVVKIGTRVLTGGDNLILPERLDRLAAEIVRLEERGISTVLVSSGAVGAGIGKLELGSYPRLIPDRQAAASVGQVQLMKMWEHAFAAYRRLVGQVLIMAEDFQVRRRYVNLQNTFDSLRRLGVIPVVNENDSVAVRELKYGDNDTLSAQVAGVVGADLLVIMTDIDGVYSANPKVDPTARRLPVIEEITPELLRATRGKGSEVSIGGMRSKISAAAQATAAGRWCVIASGRDSSLVEIVEGRDVGTLFLPHRNGMKRRKQWIAFTGRPRGRLLVDEGAQRALVERGSSLLSSGVRELEGRFEPGDVVEIARLADRAVFARGMVSYSADDLARIKGLHSSQIGGVLGHGGPEEVVHKDNLALVGPAPR